jgi:hypothetical protein
VLYDRINAQGYEECQDDILAVSGMAEDIRDALLDYQVGDDKAYTTIAPLKSGHVLQMAQLRAIYDQNRRLIVSC